MIQYCSWTLKQWTERTVENKRGIFQSRKKDCRTSFENYRNYRELMKLSRLLSMLNFWSMHRYWNTPNRDASIVWCIMTLLDRVVTGLTLKYKLTLLYTHPLNMGPLFYHECSCHGVVVSTWTSDLKITSSRPGPYHVVSLNSKLYYTLSISTQVYKWVPASCCWGKTVVD